MKGICQSKMALMMVVAGVLLLTCESAWAKIGGTRKHRANEGRKLVTVNVIGNTGDPPANRLPLSVCSGDCDDDSDCANDLICYQRGSNEAVPGCEGGEEDDSQSDYCIEDPSGPSPTSAPTSSPVPTANVTAMPTAQPTAGPTKSPTMAPSEAPSEEPVEPFGKIEYVGNEGTFYSRYPMGPCQGDCDNDNDVSIHNTIVIVLYIGAALSCIAD